MQLGVADRARPLIEAVRRMVEDEIATLDAEFRATVGRHPSGDRFRHTEWQQEILEGLKAAAASMGDFAGVRLAQPWISPDTPLAEIWAHVRTRRLADGLDAAHRRQVAWAGLCRHSNAP